MSSPFKPELLAPAGDLTRLTYALAYGADAVYAGQPAFSLRARENGFRNLDDLSKGIALCREKGRKFYLTSNVIARNAKVEPFQKALLAALELKPDALIVADPGMIGWLRKEAPAVELHLSVQANTTNWLTAKFWAEQGIQRIILSRELKLGEVLEIHKRVPEIELEVFVHGAVCMAMSGRCMLSDWTSHRDANQGMCNNSCRMPYRLYANQNVQGDDYRNHVGSFDLQRSDAPDADPIALDEDSWGTYFMSSRDLCALDSIPELTQGGIASFKIEGRTRSVYYLSQVVSAYRKAIDAVINGETIPEASREALACTDSRGWMPGFRVGPLPQNYASTSVPSNTGYVIGLVQSVNSEGWLQIQVKNQFSVNTEVEFMDPQGMVPCKILALQNVKKETVETLHPGTQGSVLLSKKVTNSTNDAFFAFLVAKGQTKTR